jgi:hypothetical protein
MARRRRSGRRSTGLSPAPTCRGPAPRARDRDAWVLGAVEDGPALRAAVDQVRRTWPVRVGRSMVPVDRVVLVEPDRAAVLYTLSFPNPSGTVPMHDGRPATQSRSAREPPPIRPGTSAGRRTARPSPSARQCAPRGPEGGAWWLTGPSCLGRLRRRALLLGPVGSPAGGPSLVGPDRGPESCDPLGPATDDGKAGAGPGRTSGVAGLDDHSGFRDAAPATSKVDVS